MLEGYVRGLIHIYKGCVRDHRWWLRTFIVLAAIERENYSKILSLSYLHTLAVAHATTDTSALDEAWKNAANMLIKCAQTIAPWLDLEQLPDISDAMEVWREIYGDPNSPEVQKKIRENLEKLRKITKRSKSCPLPN